MKRFTQMLTHSPYFNVDEMFKSFISTNRTGLHKDNHKDKYITHSYKIRFELDS